MGPVEILGRDWGLVGGEVSGDGMEVGYGEIGHGFVIRITDAIRVRR